MQPTSSNLVTLLNDGKLTPFMLHETPVRGRLVRLDNAVSEVVSRHQYPTVIARLLGETMLVAAMLSAQMKNQGVLTIQVKGDGDVKMLVVDATFDGGLRGYAEVNPEAKDKLEAMKQASLADLFGEGYLAITLDAGGSQRYQGVVGLDQPDITAAVTDYFTHSQQLNIDLMLQVQPVDNESGTWKAGGMMIEQMPSDAAGKVEARDEEDLEAWRYACTMLRTVKSEELLSDDLAAESLLTSLYHEQGVMVYPEKPYQLTCRCSRERVLNLLLSMQETDRAEMLVDGVASVHCQFCNVEERFTADDLKLKSH